LGLNGVIEENINVGTVVSIVTVLSVDVDAEFWLPKASTTVLAAIDGIRVPGVVIVVAVKVQVILSEVPKVQVTPEAVPF
jgi:hypothetical protein